MISAQNGVGINVPRSTIASREMRVDRSMTPARLAAIEAKRQLARKRRK